MNQTDDSYVLSEIHKCQDNFINSSVLLGSANIPYTRIKEVNNYLLDYNAAEGTRKKRLFPGCNELNQIEEYGEELLNKLFRTHTHYHVSFDPISGTQANQIVYNAILNKGDCILALSEKSGGHLSHLDYLKRFYDVYEYNYDEYIHDLDYTQIDKLCSMYRPKLVIAGASSFPLKIKYDIIGEICNKYGCLLLADISHTVLYILCEKHVNPFYYADFISFTTHKTTRGPRGAILAYKPHFKREIEYSIFPVSQGAPIYSQICSKVLMLEELSKDNLNKYCERILDLSATFINKLKCSNISLWINHTDSHICVMDVSKNYKNAMSLQHIYERNNIFVTACFLPNDKDIMTGLRFGFMMLATLNITNADFEKLVNIIICIYQNPSINYCESVSKIMNPYYHKILDIRRENNEKCRTYC